MATTITIPTPSIHWLAYPLLIGGVLFGLWLWHDTEVKDTAAHQALVIAKQSQVTTDTQVAKQDTVAQQTLAVQNAQLAAQLAAAKTLTAQITLLNAQAGTHIQVPTPEVDHQAINPSGVSIGPADVQVLATQAINLKECLNQTAADQIQIAGDKLQISARDTTIDAQNSEIDALKGGSRFKRFLKEAKHVGIGAGIGLLVGIAVDRKLN